MRIHLHGLGQDDSVDLSDIPLGGESSLPVDTSNLSISPDVSSLPLITPGLNPTTGSYQPSVAISSGLPGSPSVGLSPAQLSTLGLTASGAVPTSLQAQGAAQVASSTVNSANSMNYLLMAGVVVMVIFGISAMAKGR
jgi:hypothetical protein